MISIKGVLLYILLILLRQFNNLYLHSVCLNSLGTFALKNHELQLLVQQSPNLCYSNSFLDHSVWLMSPWNAWRPFSRGCIEVGQTISMVISDSEKIIILKWFWDLGRKLFHLTWKRYVKTGLSVVSRVVTSVWQHLSAQDLKLVIHFLKKRLAKVYYY